jgi:hypothetical protein
MVALAPLRAGAFGDLGRAQVGRARERSGEFLALLDIRLQADRGFHEVRVPFWSIFTQWFVSIVVITKIYGCS